MKEMVASLACDILVVRHGETDFNKIGRLQGQSLDPEKNPGLNALGQAQAATLSQALRNEPLDAVYSSDLRR